MIINSHSVIPDLLKIDGYDEVVINECHDPLVKLIETSNLRFANIYFKNHYNFAISTCYVRQTVAEMLQSAADKLPEGYILLVYDGWRPYGLQLDIFERMYQSMKLQHPYLEEIELIQQASQFASRGSLNPLMPSPHFTGGSVDVSLTNLNLEEITMGTPFDASLRASGTRYYEEEIESGKVLNFQDYQKLNNRRMLFNVMVSSGFTNYSVEWWHYDYGNQLWGKIKDKNAIYGLIAP